MQRKELPVLTHLQQSQVDQFYSLMAVSMASYTDDKGDAVLLARNQYVDATIWELLNKVPDQLLLLAAWVAWFQNRQRANTLDQVQWHASQFHREIDGALAAVQKRFAFAKELAAASTNEEPVAIAYRLLAARQGGAA
jgi:hypothetical protein